MKTKTDCGCEKDVFDCWAQGDPQHTPTPWIAIDSPAGRDFPLIGTTDAEPGYIRWAIAEVFPTDQRDENGEFDAAGNAMANAAYIVLAVNAHEELLEACKYAFQHLKPIGDVRKDYSGHLAMATLSNAIAKAGGK